MESYEQILATAETRYVKTKLARMVTIVYLVVVVLSLIIGIASATSYYHTDAGTDIYGQYDPARDDIRFGWFGISFYENYDEYKYSYFLEAHRWYHIEETYVENVILVVFIYAVLFSTPTIVDKILNRECKATALTITNSQVYGSYNNFLFKKSLKMPIEKIDNLTTISGLMDKFRSGVTLGICSASGIVKLHFVQNADEVITATIGRIEEIKEKEKRARVIAQPVVSTGAPSIPDKMKELALMKEQGFITEEEFNKKREELLSRM